MRLLLLSWVIIIFILTCTKNVYRLFEGKIEFVFSEDPHWSELFALVPWSQVSWVEFVGHFFMFFILSALLIAVMKNIPGAVVIAFVYGLVTELLQPFFSRGAEGIDLLANTVGIISFVVLYGVVVLGIRYVGEPGMKKDHARNFF